MAIDQLLSADCTAVQWVRALSSLGLLSVRKRLDAKHNYHPFLKLYRPMSTWRFGSRLAVRSPIGRADSIGNCNAN